MLVLVLVLVLVLKQLGLLHERPGKLIRRYTAQQQLFFDLLDGVQHRGAAILATIVLRGDRDRSLARLHIRSANQ